MAGTLTESIAAVLPVRSLGMHDDVSEFRRERQEWARQEPIMRWMSVAAVASMLAATVHAIAG
jgi:hypothetical protein